MVYTFDMNEGFNFYNKPKGPDENSIEKLDHRASKKLENFNVQEPKIKIEIKNAGNGITETGTTIESSVVEGLPVELVLMDNVLRFEPEEKMNEPDGKKTVEELVQKIKDGDLDSIPPVYVMEVKGGYMLLDGHHRYHAHELAGSKFITVKVVPSERVETNIID